VFEVGEEAIDRVSRRRSIEATAEPDDRVLEFSRDWTDAVDVLVVAVQERSEECWWVMISCSPPASRGLWRWGRCIRICANALDHFDTALSDALDRDWYGLAVFLVEQQIR